MNFRGAAVLLALARIRKDRWEELMATLDDIQTAVDETGDKAQAAADRVVAALDTANTRIEELTAEVESLKSQGTLDPEQADSILQRLEDIGSTLEGIAEEGEQPVIDNSLPGSQPRPDQTLPGDLPKGG